jgi:D-amino-acid oxidase
MFSTDSLMTRRRVLALAALSLVGGCRPQRSTIPAPVEPELPPQGALEGSTLVPVEIDPGREIRTIVGLRPYRAAGFVVRREEAGEKVHTYWNSNSGYPGELHTREKDWPITANAFKANFGKTQR